MMASNNTIFAIRPYQKDGFWMFDDKARDIEKEPFVAGADSLLDICKREFGEGFGIAFSSEFMPNYTFRLMMSSTSRGNGTYYDVFLNEKSNIVMTIWLCSALLKYYKIRPEVIYVRVHVRKAGKG